MFARIKYRLVFLALSLMLIPASGLFAQNGTSYENKRDGREKENVVFLNSDSTGIFRVKSGELYNMNDTIGGKVEFYHDSDNPGGNTGTYIPNISYYKLFIYGKKKKNVKVDSGETDRKFVVRDSLFIADTVYFVLLDTADINTKREVVNYTDVKGRKKFILNGTDTMQTLEANNGSFTKLMVDNDYGVRVVNGGGFNIEELLELKRGELINDADSNFTLSDSVLIVRHTYGSISNAPNFGTKVSVNYEGDEADSIFAGAEIPADATVLQNLRVNNTSGLYLDTSVTVNDTLYVGSLINTYEYDADGNLIDDTNVLLSTSGRNPVYNPNYTYAEITGNLSHNKLDKMLEDSLIYNNPYTWIKFYNPDDIAGLSEMTISMRPDEYPIYTDGQNKIKRNFEVTATDTAGNPVTDVNNMTVGYGWKHAKGDQLSNDYETNEKTVEEVLLERWDEMWTEFDGEEPPQLNADSTWAYSYTTNITKLGYFAMGMPGDGIPLVFKALVYLEGPYYNDGVMTTALNDSNLIPLSPPDMYPYNLDSNRSKYSVAELPDSIVDWIVLEFNNGTDKYFRTCFLRLDGAIVELDGYSPVQLGQGSIDTGYYYIAVKHRNHLDIVTLNEVQIARDSVLLDSLYNFSDPSFVASGFGEALKPIRDGGSVIYAMIAGESNNSKDVYGEIDYENDILEAWKRRNYKGRDGTANNFEDYKTFLIYDYDMNGIITTRDMNIGWNNRGRVSTIK